MIVESKPSQNVCAFAGNNTAFSGATPFRDVNADRSKKFPTGKARIKLLYEEYVHLQQLSRVWNTPVTNPPLLEPLFAAGFHAIELAFLLLAEFLNDSRTYVAKRPRVERVADDIADQCKLLTNLIDGELEEEGSCSGADRLTLTQPFPFPSAPPLAGRPGFSPGLSRFIKAAHAAYGRMSQAEKNSLIKTVLNITSVFHGNFQRWTVGLGLEPQLNELRAAVGLDPLSFCHSVFLDYNALVRPHVAEETLTKERYKYAEDFFFRTVHLGTECWAFIALARLQSAADHATAGHFHVAAARAHQAARILDYLGDHVMLLTQMNLKDYLDLKVELEGTSGEGSAAVKKLRTLVRSLLEPLSKACFDKQISNKSPTCDHILEQKEDTAGDDVEDSSEEERLGRALMVVYRCPDRYRNLYNYAKSLEDVESALLHFYYQHFCLAQNVIGSDARGTMRLPVQALKRTYEVGCSF
jgi:tryptophan 2,3-dioxygenase